MKEEIMTNTTQSAGDNPHNSDICSDCGFRYDQHGPINDNCPTGTDHGYLIRHSFASTQPPQAPRPVGESEHVLSGKIWVDKGNDEWAMFCGEKDVTHWIDELNLDGKYVTITISEPAAPLEPQGDLVEDWQPNLKFPHIELLGTLETVFMRCNICRVFADRGKSDPTLALEFAESFTTIHAGCALRNADEGELKPPFQDKSIDDHWREFRQSDIFARQLNNMKGQNFSLDAADLVSRIAEIWYGGYNACTPDGNAERCERLVKLNRYLADQNTQLRATVAQPINMLLFCPNCGEQHVDEAKPSVCEDCGQPESEHKDCDGCEVCMLEGDGSCGHLFNPWLNPPHKSHRCSNCNWVWRIADVPTNGVRDIETTCANDQSASPSSNAERDLLWHSMLCKNRRVAPTPAAVSQYINERDIVILNNFTERIHKLEAATVAEPWIAVETPPKHDNLYEVTIRGVESDEEYFHVTNALYLHGQWGDAGVIAYRKRPSPYIPETPREQLSTRLENCDETRDDLNQPEK